MRGLFAMVLVAGFGACTGAPRPAVDAEASAATVAKPAVELVRTLALPGGLAVAMTCSSDGAWLALQGTDGDVCIVDAARGTVMARREATSVVRFSPDGEELAGHGDHPFLWRWRDGSVRELQHGLFALDWSRDGRLLAVATGDGTAAILDAATLQVRARLGVGDGRPITGLAFDAKGAQVAVGTDWRRVQVHDVATGERVGSSLPARAFAFAAGGSLVRLDRSGNLHGFGGEGTPRKVGTEWFDLRVTDEGAAVLLCATSKVQRLTADGGRTDYADVLNATLHTDGRVWLCQHDGRVRCIRDGVELGSWPCPLRQQPLRAVLAFGGSAVVAGGLGVLPIEPELHLLDVATGDDRRPPDLPARGWPVAVRSNDRVAVLQSMRAAGGGPSPSELPCLRTWLGTPPQEVLPRVVLDQEVSYLLRRGPGRLSADGRWLATSSLAFDLERPVTVAPYRTPIDRVAVVPLPKADRTLQLTVDDLLPEVPATAELRLVEADEAVVARRAFASWLRSPDVAPAAQRAAVCSPRGIEVLQLPQLSTAAECAGPWNEVRWLDDHCLLGLRTQPFPELVRIDAATGELRGGLRLPPDVGRIEARNRTRFADVDTVAGVVLLHHGSELLVVRVQRL